MATSTTELDKRWRSAEFVTAYANWGDRGRMRGSNASPDGVLHRPTCGLLSDDRRALASAPAQVYETKLDAFRASANATGHAGMVRVCQKCCADIEVTGRRVIPPPVKDTRNPQEALLAYITDRFMQKVNQRSQVADIVAELRWSSSKVRAALNGLLEKDLIDVFQGLGGTGANYTPSKRHLCNVIRGMRVDATQPEVL